MFTRSPNYKSETGDRDSLIPNLNYSSYEDLIVFEFIGKLFAEALHTGNKLDIDLCSFIWKSLTNEPLDVSDLRSVDLMFVNSLDSIKSSAASLSPEIFEDAFCEFPFSTTLDGGKVVDLNDLPSSLCGINAVTDEVVQREKEKDEKEQKEKEKLLTHANHMKFCTLSLHAHLHAFDKQLSAIKSGFFGSFPKGLAEMMGWKELREAVCGEKGFNIDRLKAAANIPPSESVKFFWEALESFTPDQRSKFLRFCTGNARLPDNIRFSVFWLNNAPLSNLPVSHTCSYQVDLPLYTSTKVKEIIILIKFFFFLFFFKQILL